MMNCYKAKTVNHMRKTVRQWENMITPTRIIRKFLLLQMSILFIGILFGAISNAKVLHLTPTKYHKNETLKQLFAGWDVEEDAKNEVQFQAESVVTSLGWAKWSVWSACSKTCGRGVQYQLRRCMNVHCSGPSSRHRICEVEKKCEYGVTKSDAEMECELRTKRVAKILTKTRRHATNGREDASNDNIWFPINTVNNCSLSCQSAQSGEIRHFGISLKDGAKCILPNVETAACLHAQCQRVGCDGVIGSTMSTDICGRCGGDGLDCDKKVFQWKDTQQFTPCDRTCGPNRVRVSVSVCLNTLTQRVVPERLCADQARPRPRVHACPHVVCPANAILGLDYTWLTAGWSECSKSCGVGEQNRDVYCVEIHAVQDEKRDVSSVVFAPNVSISGNFPSVNQFDSSHVDSALFKILPKPSAEIEKRKVADQYCWQLQKPVSVRKCERDDCPEWKVGEWSVCSATCGKGQRKRNVECVSAGRRVDDFFCAQRQSQKPVNTQSCYTGLKCSIQQQGAVHNNAEQSSTNNEWDAGPQYAALQYSPLSTADGMDAFAPNEPSARPRFIAGPWSACSASCGDGMRSRVAECVALQSVTAHQIKLPDYECEGQTKPVLFESCQLAVCGETQAQHSFALINKENNKEDNNNENNNKTNDNDKIDTMEKEESRFAELTAGRPMSTMELSEEDEDFSRKQSGMLKTAGRKGYDWEYGEWTACSASCLGGHQKTTLKCMDTSLKTAVPFVRCDSRQRPMERTRACNKVACPPQWEASEFSACSHSCGGGLRSRRVRCIRTVSRSGGAESTLILPDAQCSAPKPAAEEPCGMVDCPASWRLGRWSVCSASCGAGEQRRDVACEQRDAYGVVHNFENGERCSDGSTLPQRPSTLRLCNLGPCPEFLQRPEFSIASALPLRATMPWDENHLNWAFSGTNEPVNDTTRRRHATTKSAQNGEDDEENNRTAKQNRVANNALTKDESDTANVVEADERDDFEQTNAHHRKLTLDVGGFANLYEGTSVKVKCPVRNFDRDKIYWTKDGKRIVSDAHMKVSTNGALRIFHARMHDAGVYACFANGVKGNVTLTFKPAQQSTQKPQQHGHNAHNKNKNNHTHQKQKISTNRTNFDSPNSTKIKSKTNEDKAQNETVDVKFDFDLLQKVKDSLYRLGERQIFERLEQVNDPTQVRLDFAVGEWSRCSQLDCGRPDGAQVRMLRCRIYVAHLTAFADDEICASFGVQRPPATRPCVDARCPRWEALEWSQCWESRCLREGVALQKRVAKCVYSNGTKANYDRCDRKSRPKIKKECENTNCTSEWRPSVWGKCSKSCGDGGVQMRLLRCVWHGTRKAAGRHCDPSRRPTAIRMCDPAALKHAKCTKEDNKTNKFGKAKTMAATATQKSEKSSIKASNLSETDGSSVQFFKSVSSTSEAPSSERLVFYSREPIQFYETSTQSYQLEADSQFLNSENNLDSANNVVNITPTTTERVAEAEVVDYAEWKSRHSKTATPAKAAISGSLPPPVALEPFKGWERWRGWRLYNWPQPEVVGQFRRLHTH